MKRSIAALVVAAQLSATVAKAQESAPPGLPAVTGYRTDSGRALPVLQHQPYQAARRLWFTGFVTTMVGLGVMFTGSLVLMAGGLSQGTYTEEGRQRVLLGGGLVTGFGAAAAITGGALWYVGWRDLRGMERGLPAADGVMRPALTLSF